MTMYSTPSFSGSTMTKNISISIIKQQPGLFVSVKSLVASSIRSLTLTTIFAIGLAGATGVSAQSIDLAQSPVLALKTAPGLVMLTMGRDLPLYRAAYNDVNDIDGDGILDIYFKPAFKYEGYFAHNRCYNYANSVFTPASIGTAVQIDANDRNLDYYTCAGNWSGNFLNWVAMARIDTLRKVLYGGKRSTDTVNAAGVGTTVLERTYVPQDSTMWGKEYTSLAVDGYDIRLFTPLALPNANLRHMFANTTLASTGLNGAPLMLVYANRSGRIWSLVAQEAPILGVNPTTAATASRPAGADPEPSTTRGTITSYTVRVATCVPLVVNGNNVYESWCTGYPKNAPTSYKPTGLLHKYGEAKTLAFGLISGTYDNNYAGGVLRQNVDDFDQEVNAANGKFTAVQGVVYHLNQFKPIGITPDANGSPQWNCGSWTGLPPNGNCPAWGNPLGEMMFEGLQYFAGGTRTAAFSGAEPIANNATNNLGLQQPAWRNPYAANAARARTAAYPSCARPIQMTIGDPKTSFDSDHLPGAAFAVGANGINMGVNSTPTLGALNVSTEADAIWNSEFGVNASRSFFIGEVLGNSDGNPTAKAATSFRNIRGHGPDATTNEGSFYGASVARYGKFSGINNPALPNTTLRANQISIALDSHIPKIQIPMGNGQTVSMVLLSKSVGDSFGAGISNARNAYQITGSITGFFIDQMVNTDASNQNSAINQGRPFYRFRVSFSDADQGNDNESDAKVTYEIRVTSATTLSVGMDYFSGSNGIEMHQGYVISGTTNDGAYLDVGAAAGFTGVGYANPMVAPARGYFLDTRPNTLPGSAMAAPATGPAFTNITGRLPITTIATPRVFTVGNNPAAGQYVPHDMLWYAAKYGGADVTANGSLQSFRLKPNGDPDSYYFVNNPSKLSEQLGQAFQKAASLSIAISTAVSSSGVKVNGGNLVYQASFDSVRWGGNLRAFEVQTDGNISNTAKWESTLMQPAPDKRNVVLGLATAADPKLKSALINSTSFDTLTSGAATFKDNATFKYLLGDRSKEQGANNGTLRERNSAVGDIVNSDPLYIGKSDFGFTGASYQKFKEASDPKLIAVGSNDGFYRLISAVDGVEKLAFIPAAIASNMKELADPNYAHRYFVDGPSAFGHVNFGSETTPDWNAVVAGTLGAGGKAVFALNASAANVADSSAVLWEVNENDATYGENIGNILNKPVVAHLRGAVGAPVVLVGNGANSAVNKASLIVIHAKTGKVLKTCTPNNAANSLGNGMTSIAAISNDNDGTIDVVYAADYKGNIWRINPNDPTQCNSADKIFTAKDSAGKLQPITGDITVIAAPSPKTGYMILFGTGKLSGASDPANKDVQTLYGVWDENEVSSTINASRSDLIAYPFTGINATQQVRAVPKQADINGGKAWYDTAGKKGWMIDLKCNGCPTGERFVDKPLVAGKASAPVVYFLSHIPSDDACKVGGDGWVTGFDPNTGAFAKAFTKLPEANSVFVPGAAPRGLFIVTTKNGDKPDKEYIYVSVNGDPGTSNNDSDSPSKSTDFDDKTGGKSGSCVTGADCIGEKGKEITPDPDPVPVLGRRLVWRQIQ
jgi:type IV pilus assembly protein PilY1